MNSLNTTGRQPSWVNSWPWNAIRRLPSAKGTGPILIHSILLFGFVIRMHTLRVEVGTEEVHRAPPAPRGSLQALEGRHRAVCVNLDLHRGIVGKVRNSRVDGKKRQAHWPRHTHSNPCERLRRWLSLYYTGVMEYCCGVMEYYSGVMEYYSGVMEYNFGVMNYYCGVMEYYCGVME